METILEMYEGEDMKIQFTLSYSETWSNAGLQGQPVAKSDCLAVYFAMKEKESDTAKFVDLAAVDPFSDTSEIEWTDDDGVILCKLPGADTVGHAGKNRLYEVRVKLSDGTYFTAKKGKIHIFESLIDRP